MNSVKRVFTPGKLFVWGAWGGKQSPQLVKLPENVIKASVGPEHIATIGESGNLYTFGSGKDGKLGHGDKKDHSEPVLVEYFQKHNIKVKDAVCGQRHTIVLSESGDVYTFGFGGKHANFLYKIFFNTTGPLGLGPNTLQEVSKPVKVKKMEGHKIQRITAGRHFNMVFNEKGEVFNWGNGQYGAFGDGANKNHSLPVKNEHFDYLRKDEKLQIVKVKSCESFSVALMNNGKLYGWGSNQSGQMGIKAEIGIEMYETVNYVTEIIREGYENQKVINFDISENTLLFELDNGEVWWSGMKIAYKPEKIMLSEKPKLFAAGSKCFVVVNHNNEIYFKKGFLKVKGQADATTDLRKENATNIFNGELVGIGGQYGSRYAIVV